MKKTIKNIILILFIISVSTLAAACGKNTDSTSANSSAKKTSVDNTANTSSASSTSDSGSSSSTSSSQSKSKASDNNKAVASNTSYSQASAGIAKFIPQGFHILERTHGKPEMAVGDLNNDGINDVAAVLQGTNKADPKSAPRELLIAFGNKNKGYTLSVIAPKAILLANEGGVFGDPLESITVNRGSLLLNFYGGSNDRWYSSYRFRYQNKGWYLIGATLGSYNSGTTTRENADQEDYNLLTGDYIFRNADKNGKLVTTKGKRVKKPLVNLMNFAADADDKNF